LGVIGVVDRRKMRRSLLLGAAWSMAGGHLGPAHAEVKLERPRLVMAVGARTSLQQLPLTIAERLGYYSAEGLEVEVLDLGTGARAQQAMLEGAVDIACSTFDDFLVLYAKKQLHRAFVLVGRAPQVAFGVSKRYVPGYRKASDLKGMAIGIAAPGVSAMLVAKLVLARAGLSAQEVRFVEAAGVVAALQAIRSGQVDAMVHVEPVMTMLEQKGDVRIIGDTRSLKGASEIFGGMVPASCLHASADYLQNHPNTVQALTNAVVRALKWLQTAGPSDLIKAVPDAYLLGDRALYLASFGKVRESIAIDGLIAEDSVKNIVRIMARLEPALQADKFDLDRLFTNTFALKAKERFRA